MGQLVLFVFGFDEQRLDLVLGVGRRAKQLFSMHRLQSFLTHVAIENIPGGRGSTRELLDLLTIGVLKWLNFGFPCTLLNEVNTKSLKQWGSLPEEVLVSGGEVPGFLMPSVNTDDFVDADQVPTAVVAHLIVLVVKLVLAQSYNTLLGDFIRQSFEVANHFDVCRHVDCPEKHSVVSISGQLLAFLISLSLDLLVSNLVSLCLRHGDYFRPDII